MPIPLFGKLLKAFTGTGGIADAINLEVNQDDLKANLDGLANNVQAQFEAIDDFSLLSGASVPSGRTLVITRVSGADISIDLPAAQIAPADTRALNVFFGAVTVTAANRDSFIGRNSVYAARADARVNFLLPLEADIASYPVLIEISNFGGTARFDTGAAPTNTVVIDTQVADTTAIETAAGTPQEFIEVHRGDVAVLTKAGAGQNWVSAETSADPRSAILPEGLFNLNSRTINVAGATILGLSLFTPSEGDAFTVNAGGTGFGFAREVKTNDVLVALVDNPSLVINGSNDDWLHIVNATNSVIPLAEARFLGQVQEGEATVGASVITDVYFWLVTPAPVADPGIGTGDLTTLENATDITKFLVVAVPTASVPANLLVRIFSTIDDSLISETPFENVFTDYSGTIADVGGRQFYIWGDTVAGDPFSITSKIKVQIWEEQTQKQYTFKNQVNVNTNVTSVADSKLTNYARLAIGNSLEPDGDDYAKIHDLEATFQDDDLIVDADVGDLLWKVGGPSASGTDYEAFTQTDGIPAQVGTATPVTILVPAGSSSLVLRKVASPGTTATLTFIATFQATVANDRRAYDAYSASLPAQVAVVGHTWQVAGTRRKYVLSGAESTFKIHRANLDGGLEQELDNHGAPLPTVLDQLAGKLSDTTDASPTAWTVDASPTIDKPLTRVAAALWIENRQAFTGNFFADVTPAINVTGFSTINVFYYSTPAEALTPSNPFPGAQSFIFHDNIRLENASGSTPIVDDWNKIIAFDYRLTRRLIRNERFNILRIGDTNHEPLIQTIGPNSVGESGGLVLRTGVPGGAAQSRTIREFLQVDNSQWRFTIAEDPLNEDAEIIIPDDETGTITVTIDVRAYNNDNDIGVHTESYTITDVGVDQGFGARQYSWTSPTLNVDFTVSYDAVNDDLSFSRRILDVSATLTNPAFHYQISAHIDTTVNWTQPTTYNDLAIDAGNPFDSNGIYDPSRYTTSQGNQSNRILAMIVPVGGTTSTGNLEMGMRLIVDGEREGDTAGDGIIPLGRHVADFDFSDLRFGQGSSQNVISHIQVYDYDKTNPPTEADLLALYCCRNPLTTLGTLGFGMFDPPGHATVEDFLLSAKLRVQSSMGGQITDAEQAFQNAAGAVVRDVLFDASLQGSGGALTAFTFPAGVTKFGDYSWVTVDALIGGDYYSRTINPRDGGIYPFSEEAALATNRTTLVVNGDGDQFRHTQTSLTVPIQIVGYRLQDAVVAP